MKRGVITLVFDDGYAVIYRDIVSLLNQYRMPAVFAPTINHQKIAAETKQDITAYQAWLPLTAAGHEIAAHTINHVDLTTAPLTERRRELAEPARLLQAQTLIYPGGVYNPAVTDQAKLFYRAARTTSRGFEQLPPPHPYQLKTFNYTSRNSSLIKLNLRAAFACLTNSWLIETFHLIDSLPSPLLHTVDPDIFHRHLKFIRRLPIEVLTIKQILDRYHL